MMTRLGIGRQLMLLMALVIVIFLFVVGDNLAPEIKQLGLTGYLKQGGWQAGLFIFGFVFAFPVALLLIVLSGLQSGLANWKYHFVLFHVFLLGSLLVVIWPFVAGRENSVSYFAYSGGLLLILIYSVGWFWAQQRNNSDPADRKAMDMKGIGYFFFALATWNMCGVAGMPGYALYPERSLEDNAYPFIIGQVKVVMLYLVIAWLSLLLSYLLRNRQD